MIHAPDSFIDALRFGTYLVDVRITVYSGGAPTQYVLPLSACDITVSRSAAQRRSGSITVELEATVPPQPAMPTGPGSPLAPFGNEIFVELALQQPHLDPSGWVPVGLFDIATSTITDSSADVVVSLDLYDRSWVIDQRTFLEPYNIPAVGGNFDDEIVHLASQVWGSDPPLRFNIVPTSEIVPSASYNEGDSPWQAIQDMASATGYEVYFDINGILTAHPIPTPADQPTVFNFGPNNISVQGILAHPLGSSPYMTPTAIVSTLTRDRIYNDVIVSGTGSQNAPGATSGSTSPVRAEAKDTKTGSATNVNGPVGDVPEFVQTPLATTVSAAQAIADNDLAQGLSQAWQLQVSSQLNPLFEIDDVVSVTDARLGLNGVRMVIDTIEFGVRYDAATQITGRVLT